MLGPSSEDSDELLEPSRYRVLLDQNFPKPPGFDISQVDRTVEVVHLADFDDALAKVRVPDWLIYLRAAEAGFDAMVTRDSSQLELAEELWVLTKVKITLVTFRKAIEDPIVEWGQLLAYLPLIRRRPLAGTQSRIIHLPKPALSDQRHITKAKDLLHRLAGDTGISVKQLRSQATVNIREHLTTTGRPGILARLSL